MQNEKLKYDKMISNKIMKLLTFLASTELVFLFDPNLFKGFLVEVIESLEDIKQMDDKRAD